MATWHTVSAPRGTPAPVVARLNRAIVESMRTPDMRERFVALGTEPVGSSVEALRDLIAREVPRWSGLLVEIGLHPKQ
jgi:tripartite-type tricarboxylate transporter receptor subunit TctC